MADIKTSFSILTEKDELDIEIINKLITVSPSRQWKKGDPVKADNRLFRKESCWAIEFHKKTVDLETCIIELSDFINTHTEHLKKLHYEYGFVILLKFVITIHSFTSPIISMEEEFIKKLADIGASFYISLYYDDEEDDSPDAWGA